MDRLKQELQIVKRIFEIMTDRKEMFINYWKVRSEAYTSLCEQAIREV